MNPAMLIFLAFCCVLCITSMTTIYLIIQMEKKHMLENPKSYSYQKTKQEDIFMFKLLVSIAVAIVVLALTVGTLWAMGGFTK